MFRHYAALLSMFCVGCAYLYPVYAWAEPQRIVSLNLCTDQLLLAVADPGQIASVTFLARSDVASAMAKEAARHSINYGQVEELIPLRPDLVVTLSYTAPGVLRLLRQLGYDVELFAPAASINDVVANIRRMAALVGRESRGEVLVGNMQERMRSYALTVAANKSRPPRGLIYGPNGYTSGERTLPGELMRLAGWHNAAAEAGITGVGVIGLEALVLVRPDRIILSPYAPGTHSLGQRLLRHPALNAVVSGNTPVVLTPKLWMCGGPVNVDAVAQLAAGR